MNPRRLWAVVAKEWAEITRDRLFTSLAFVVPAALMLLFGYGLNMDVENIPLAIVDHDRSPDSRDYAYRFIDSRYFDFKGMLQSESEIDHLLSAGAIRAAIVIPPDFSKRIGSHRPVSVQTLLDGTFPLRANIARGYVAAINGAYNQNRIADLLAQGAGLTREQARDQLGNLALEVRLLYNQSGKSIWSMAPKLVMLVLMMTPPLLTAVSVVREKERGSILNIYASTVSRGEFLVGKLAPYAAISTVNGVLLWVLAVYLFGAPFKGSFLFFLVVTVIYSVCTTGIGLLVSSFVRTQIAAIVMTMVVTLVPAMLYSGLLIPLSSLGPEAKVMAYLAPAMHYARIIDGTFLKGIGPGILWPAVLALLIYASVLFILAYWLFTKRPSA
ncbi:MAG: ABC transporter permease [Pseudomonadota bacterium]|nr:ABC transporter permease [Pseudomonadota bacterium]